MQSEGPSKDKEPAPWQRNLFACLVRLSQLRREALDQNMVQTVLLAEAGAPVDKRLSRVARSLHMAAPKLLSRPDPAFCPLLLEEGEVFSILLAQRADGSWSALTFDDATRSLTETQRATPGRGSRCYRMSVQQHYVAGDSPSLRIIAAQVLGEKRALSEIVAGSVFVSVIALATSIYSMQVYDRVIPTGATATLLVLTLGVLVAAVLDTMAKTARSHAVSEMSDRVDQKLARAVYARFLGVRLDAMPATVGILAQRMRSYESVRQFLVGVITSFLVDIPLALFLLVIFAMIGGPLALVPAVFLLVGVVVALFVARTTERIARASTPAHNLKTGHLVESVEGIEVIKAGNGGWRMLARWLDLTDQARALDKRMKDVSEGFQYFIGLFQQVSYTLLIALGALYVGTGSITMGGLIACTILSGRIVSPLAALANFIVQWSNTKASLQDLDRFWGLAQDLDPAANPLFVERIRGDYRLEAVKVEHQGQVALQIDALSFAAGETVAILGAIGSGKTTLLRLLSGLYAPGAGRITLDGLTLTDIDKSILARELAFVPQDGRLFAGTLRDNLLIGLDDPGDPSLIDAAKVTGLYDSAVADHPKGLARDIHEGGIGLSGGQRQLVHVTRAMLRRPRVWLLDEPTASMDGQSEARVVEALRQARTDDPSRLFVFVTHKPQIAALAERVIILHKGRVAMDGPRDDVFRQLERQALVAAQGGGGV